jgi:hypothetical protein
MILGDGLGVKIIITNYRGLRISGSNEAICTRRCKKIVKMGMGGKLPKNMMGMFR